MTPIWQEYLDKILEEYTTVSYYDQVVEAKDKYLKLTGPVSDDGEDYESRMNSFNDWYLFNYLPANSKSTMVSDYLAKYEVPNDVAISLENIVYSLYEVKKMDKTKTVLKDIIHNYDVVLKGVYRHIGCVKDDIFIGRVLTFAKKDFLLQGVSTMPHGAKKLLVKRAKILGGEKDPNIEYAFLLKLELLKTRHRHYPHLDPNSIFK